MAQPVRIDGLDRTLRALKATDPLMEKEIRKEINQAAGSIRDLARRYVPAESPMSGWTADNWGARGYDAAAIRKGITVKRRGSRKRRNSFQHEIRIVNSSAAGVIYELAGSKSNGYSPQGRQFIQNISNSGLRAPLRRLVVRAGVEKGEEARRRIFNATVKAEYMVKRMMRRG